jgi:hypothetical protein
MSDNNSVTMSVRIPADVKAWLKAEARKRLDSENGAIVAIIRGRMARERAEYARRVKRVTPAPAPAAAP